MRDGLVLLPNDVFSLQDFDMLAQTSPGAVQTPTPRVSSLGLIHAL